ncbi:hypothetical protein GCM10009557_66530 [Virgisporangium ochraceum]|uniref:Uncharacterized protein n=1 Tax=Virgisporangium ochraceum TaxID=65505 RepID=A0A8J3ZM17_9ACTN|nr:hypothetical protein [Virgisporangium ochraceum]GIJ66226.1 hypothetical protein Voc01_011430 [Virgisporangium ochraceum]
MTGAVPDDGRDITYGSDELVTEHDGDYDHLPPHQREELEWIDRRLAERERTRGARRDQPGGR